MLAMTVGCAPLPRPQVRSDPDGRLLLPLRHLRLVDRTNRGPGHRQRPQIRPPPSPSRKKLSALKDDLAKYRSAKFKEISAEVRTPQAIADYLIAARGVRDTKPEDADKFKAALVKFNVRRGVLIGWRTYLASVKIRRLDLGRVESAIKADRRRDRHQRRRRREGDEQPRSSATRPSRQGSQEPA